jgi:hypothetical protein
MAVKPSKPKTSKKQKPEKKSSPPKKRKSVTSKTNTNHVRTTQQGLVNQAAKTGNQTTVVRIINALAKASARVNRRYAGIPKTPTPYAQPSIGIAPAFNIQFPSMGANYDNGMREVNGMRNDIINEFRRLNPNAAYAPPPPPPAPPGAPAMGAVAAAPPPMSEHPDAVYEENAGGAGSAAMSIDPSVQTEPEAPVAPAAEAEAMDIDPIGDPEVPAPVEVPEPVVVPPAPQDPFHVGGHAEIPVAERLIPEEPNFINLGDADEPLLEQLFPNMVDGATATETSSEGTIPTNSATTRSRGTSTVDFDNAIRPMELEFQQPAVAPDVTPPPDEILPEERRNPRGPEEIIPDQEQITHQTREGTPEVTPPPEEILPGERRNPRGPEEIIPDQAQITHRNQEEEDDRQLARRPQAWQEYAEEAHLDRGLTPQRPPAMHLADMAAAMNRRGTRGINNRPGTPRPGSLSLPAPQPPQPAPVFDQTNQQNMSEHMDTPDNGVGGATGTIPGFPEVPADLESFTFDASSFPDLPGYLNSGPPTSPVTTAFIDDYLNAPTSPHGLLGFEGGPVIPEPTTLLAPATAPFQELVPEVVPAPATGMTTGTTPKKSTKIEETTKQSQPLNRSQHTRGRYC